VFVVGCLGDWESAAKVLFESDCLSGDNKKSRVKKEATATYSERGVAYGGTDGECADTVTSKWAKGSGGPSGSECGLFVAHKVYETHPADSRVKEMGEVCQTVTSRWGTGGGNVPLVQAIPIHAQATQYKGGGENRNNDGKGNGLGVGNLGDPMNTLDTSSRHAVAYIVDRAAFNQGANALYEPRIEQSEVMPTLVSKGPHAVMNHMAVRRLTPRECERLQGFKDDYTVIPWKKGESPDGHRYKALGNSMAVPVMKWIGERINEINKQI
jgi:DNA (cytosine-5)-methyltransferase 1